MNLINSSIIFISTLYGIRNSPFISRSMFSIPASNIFINCISKYQLSSFFYSTSLFQQNTVIRSSFSHFLNSVFVLQTNDIQEIYGFSCHNDNPAIPENSFQCKNSDFYNNTTPFNGACISLTTNQLFTCYIFNSQFVNNSGSIGGAIFFSSPTGNTTIDSSKFINNTGQIASHFFITSSILQVEKSVFQQGIGTRSSMQLTIQMGITTASFYFRGCRFFRDEAPISFESILHGLSFYDCCFLNYKLAPDYPYIFNFFKTEAILSFESCTINQQSISATDIYIGQVGNYLTTSGNIINCFLVPTPSATNGDHWDSRIGIITITTISFFGVISIIGIVMVSCCKCSSIPNIREEPEELRLHNMDDM